MLCSRVFSVPLKRLLCFALLAFLPLSLILTQKTYTIYAKSSQSPENGNAEKVWKIPAKNRTSLEVEKSKTHTVSETISRDEGNLCSNYQDIYSRCDPTILQDVSTLNLITQNKDKFLQSLSLSKRKQTTSNRVTCPREPLQRFNSSVNTGLISHPGSGNTWTRHILQQLTGLMTGSIYNSKQLIDKGFPGEPLKDHVIAVKSHAPAAKGRVRFDRRIIILRNPYHSIIAEFKRSTLGFGKIASTNGIDKKSVLDKWQNYFNAIIARWSSFVTTVLQNPSKSTLVLFYEDMTACLLLELVKLANFLKTDKLTKFSLCCVLKKTEGTFHRNHTNDLLTADTLYSKSQQRQMDQTLEHVASQLESTHPIVAQRIYDYRRGGK